MTDHQNFKNGDNHFNIFLNENGDLEFNANGDSGGGDTRMTISNVASQVTIGGSGRFGQVQLKSSTGETPCSSAETALRRTPFSGAQASLAVFS
jgi:hypothetical protein